MSFTVKFDKASMDNVQANVKQAFEKVIKNNKMLNEVGEVIVIDIQQQTRAGKSIPLGEDLALLKDNTIDGRIYLSKHNERGEGFEEGLSNLTLTGQLLKSLSWLAQGPGMVKIYFKGIHLPYKSGKGNTIGKRIPNEELAEYMAKGDLLRAPRPILGVRPTIKRRINRIVKDYVKRALIVARLSKK